MAFAENTKVPIDRSQAEIRKTLSKYGATGFAFAERGSAAVVMFEMQGRRIMFRLPMPENPVSRAKCTGADIKNYEQTCRSRWRSLVLGIKAKLECVDSKITTLEDEFLAHIVLPDGTTVGDVISEQIQLSYQTKEMPPLLGYN